MLTLTLTGPVALPFAAGRVAVTEVAVGVPTIVACVTLNLTTLARVRFVPVMVMALPPAVEPATGEMLVMCGIPAKVYAFCWVTLPPAALIAMKEAPPSGYGGVCRVIVVSLNT